RRSPHTNSTRDWSSDVCSSDLQTNPFAIRCGRGITLALRTKFLLFTILLAVCSLRGGESESSQKEDESPADHLPAHIKRITWFRSEERRVGEECRQRMERRAGR